MILAYQIYSISKQLSDIIPYCISFAHDQPITSIITGPPLMYGSTVATLSQDGTFSLISVEDLTVVLNRKHLFSENSQCLGSTDSNPRIILASQSYGSVEVADIIDSTIVIRISNFSSVISSLHSRQAMQCISTSDGHVSVFVTNNQSVACMYSISPHTTHPICHSLISPSLEYLLLYTETEWSLYDSDDPFYTESVSHNDSISSAHWLSPSRFSICTYSGSVSIYELDVSTPRHIFSRMHCHQSFFKSYTLNSTSPLSPQIIGPPEDTTSVRHRPPTLIFRTLCTLPHPGAPIGFTPEGFVVSAAGCSLLRIIDDRGTNLTCDLKPFFTNRIRCRCPIGFPIAHEARITTQCEIFFDSSLIGRHTDAHLLFSPPRPSPSFTALFFSFGRDGSIKAWSSDREVASINALCEPIHRVEYIQQTESVAVIGERDSFCVLDLNSLRVTTLCCGHDSPIVEVTYASRLYHARCESSAIYSWASGGRLVSKRNSKSVRRLGENSALIDVFRSSTVSHLEPDRNETPQEFARAVNISMPGCQTFAIILDAFKFLEFSKQSGLEEIDLKNDPRFLTLNLLWHSHLRKHPLNSGLPGNFTFAFGGDNFTVSLPLAFTSTKNHSLIRSNASQRSLSSVAPHGGDSVLVEDDVEVQRPKLSRHMTSNKMETLKSGSRSDDKLSIDAEGAFRISPLVTAAHAIVSNALAQCFVNSRVDENLGLLSAQSQTYMAAMITDPGHVPPSIVALADWIDFDFPQAKQIIIDTITQTFASVEPQQALDLFKTVQSSFSDSSPQILMMELIISKEFLILRKGVQGKELEIIEELARKAAKTLVPNVLKHEELLDLLFSTLPKFLKYIKDYSSLLSTLIEKVPSNKAAGFGVFSPTTYFECILKSQQFEMLLSMLLERWVNPDRQDLYTIIARLIMLEQEMGKNFEKVFQLIEKREPYCACSKEVLALGTVEGSVVIFDRSCGNILWQRRLSAAPVSFVSISPNSQRIVIGVADDKKLYWVSKKVEKIGKGRETGYDLVGSDGIVLDSLPVRGEWSSNNRKVVLYARERKFAELTAPDSGLFKLLF